MLKSRLYWKVLANFGLLLIVITVLAFLTLNVLGQIEKSFNLASKDIGFLNDLEELRHYLSNMTTAADEYLFTGSKAALDIYQRGARDFEVALNALLKDPEDSVTVLSLNQIRDLYFAWRENVGDKKISLHTRLLSGKGIEADLRSLTVLDSREQYLVQARGLVREIYKFRTASQPRRIELASELTDTLATFVGFLNILLAVFALTLGFVLTRSITKPVGLLTQGTQNIMSGKFEPINLHRSDELGVLAADFNKMSAMLGSNYTRLNAYSELVTALNMYATVEDVESKSLQIICHHAKAVLGALYLMDTERNVLELSAGYGLTERDDHIKRFTLGEGIPGQCALEQRVLEVDDLPTASGFVVDTGLSAVTPKHVIAVPILFQDKLLGVLVLGSMHPFDDSKKEILNNSVPQIGVAITNARNYASAQKLSREIARKNEELNMKNKELEKAYRVKSDFLSNMSHELRTPLNSIIGFSSILLGPHGDPLTPDQRLGLDKVLKNGKHLLQLINDILDFSKIEAGRMPINIEKDEVENVVSSSVMTVEAMVKGKELSLIQKFDPDLPMLNTDVLKIKQILVNLLSNAAKFTDKGSISISVSKRNGLLVFAVADSGIGIEKKNLDLVFQEFHQIDTSTTRKYQGTGLGLPISRRLAKMLGGDLSVESEYGKGSTFTLIVPSVFPEELKVGAEVTQPIRKAPAAPPAEKPQPVSQGTLILCIDDDPDVLEILRKYLVPEGYSVATALSGDEGIDLAARINPQLITLDVMMPQKDGWQVLRELKQNPKTKNIPVLIHSMIDNKPLALSLGALDVMPKPLDPRRLLTLIKEVVQSKEEQYVLIVDDSEDFSLAVKKLLEDDGFSAKVAYNGKEAMEIVQESSPALILLDLVMPVMDGFEVVRRLQENDRWRGIPVIILSGKELTPKEREDLYHHVSEYMHKSEFSHEAISKTVSRILGNNRR